MATVSMRDTCGAGFSSAPWSSGLRQMFHQRLNPFYKDDTGVPRPSPAGAPLGNPRLPTARTLSGNLTWPTGDPTGLFSPRENHPINVRPACVQSIQGISHDTTSWYVSQQFRLWKFPFDVDMSDWASDGRAMSASIPADLSAMGYDHFGDIDYFGGRLYVPLEGEGAGLPARVLIYSADDLTEPPVTAVLGEAPFSGVAPTTERQTTGAPWCAVNPMSGLLYSSRFNADELYVYELVSGRMVTYLGALPLLDGDGRTITIERVQGGAFTSTSGHLYLVSNTPDGGIIGVDIVTGRRVVSMPVAYQPHRAFPVPRAPSSTGAEFVAVATGGASVVAENVISGPDSMDVAWEELEGITLCDCDDGRAPGISGQVHVLVNCPDLAQATGYAAAFVAAGFRIPPMFPTMMTGRHFGVWDPDGVSTL